MEKNIEKMLRDADVELKLQIAKNIKTDVEVLKYLVEDKDINVMKAVLNNEMLPSNYLVQLAKTTKNQKILLELSRNNNVFIETEENEYTGKEEIISETPIILNVAKNEYSTEEILLEVLKTNEKEKLDKGNYLIESAVAKNPNVTSEILKDLLNFRHNEYENIDLDLFMTILGSDKLPSEILEELSNWEESSYDQISLALVQNENISQSTLIKILQKENIDQLTKEIILENPKINLKEKEKTLMNLSKSKNDNDRVMVADNPNTPIGILESLSKDDDMGVKMAVASNKNTPTEILDKLSKDEYERVREQIASNKNTPTEILDKLSKDESEWVRAAVASNKNTPTEILDKLSKDEYLKVVLEVAKNLNTSQETLKNLLEIEGFSLEAKAMIQINVAGNLNLDVKTLTILSVGQESYLSLTAKETLEKIKQNQEKIIGDDKMEEKEYIGISFSNKQIGKSFEGKDGKEYVSIQLPKGSKYEYGTFIFRADKVKQSKKNENMSYIYVLKDNEKEIRKSFNTGVDEKGEKVYEEKRFKVTGEQLKEEMKFRPKYVGISFSNKQISEPFEGKDGKEYVSIQLPKGSKYEYGTFIVGADKVKQSKNSETMSYVCIEKDNEKEVRKSFNIGVDEQGNKLYENKSFQLTSEQLKEEMDSWKEKPTQNQDRDLFEEIDEIEKELDEIEKELDEIEKKLEQKTTQKEVRKGRTR